MLEQTESGVIITLNDFKCFDKIIEKEECKKLEIAADGSIVAVGFVPGFNCPDYWDILIRDGSGQRFDRPSFNGIDSDYYLAVIEAARAANVETVQIKFLQSLFEMSLRHERQSAKLEEELETGTANKRRPKWIRRIYKY
jgi:hypothetical protein